ncbi:hypothetical protein KSF_104570 [Reticulibacter mediterranei]|uniref:Uncharacterized protein n=1 Tax=Reticulibacter mediterranei TaxID=2778369 RepID=A0A8J3IR26_9CHLR|nr:hypothetical protein [Reticulibacter mediterranei]GHP00410.1 hypothetical protein KSF_104570 [Reticulibacter mediterranei]
MARTDNLLLAAIIITRHSLMGTGRLERHKIPVGQVDEQALIAICRIRERLRRIAPWPVEPITVPVCPGVGVGLV